MIVVWPTTIEEKTVVAVVVQTTNKEETKSREFVVLWTTTKEEDKAVFYKQQPKKKLFRFVNVNATIYLHKAYWKTNGTLTKNKVHYLEVSLTCVWWNLFATDINNGYVFFFFFFFFFQGIDMGLNALHANFI